MKRSEEIKQKIIQKRLEQVGWARDYRTQTSRLSNEIEKLNRELEAIQEMRTPDYEVRVKIT